jgi:uncharacterized protein
LRGFDRIEAPLTQPLLIVAGTEAGSLWHSQMLYEKAASTAKELVLLEGETHCSLYNGESSLKAMARVGPFFTANL